MKAANLELVEALKGKLSPDATKVRHSVQSTCVCFLTEFEYLIQSDQVQKWSPIAFSGVIVVIIIIMSSGKVMLRREAWIWNVSFSNYAALRFSDDAFSVFNRALLGWVRWMCGYGCKTSSHNSEFTESEWEMRVIALVKDRVVSDTESVQSDACAVWCLCCLMRLPVWGHTQWAAWSYSHWQRDNTEVCKSPKRKIMYLQRMLLIAEIRHQSAVEANRKLARGVIGHCYVGRYWMPRQQCCCIWAKDVSENHKQHKRQTLCLARNVSAKMAGRGNCKQV